MVREDHTDWIKATFVNYQLKSDGFHYMVCTPSGTFCYQYCKKGWTEDENDK